MLRRLLSALFGDLNSAEIVDRAGAFDELRREREQAWAEDSLPTFKNVWGCINCGVLQVKPKDARCGSCRSSEVLDLRRLLERGHERIDFRSRDRRSVLQFRKAQ